MLMNEFEFQVMLVKELKMNVEVLKKQCEDLLKLIDDKGIDRHYSINNNIFEKATNVYKISALLGYIKTFNLEIENLNVEDNKEKDNNGKQ